MTRILPLAAALCAAMFACSHASAQTPAPTTAQAETPSRLPVFDVSTVKPAKSSENGARFFFTPSGLSIENVTLQGVIRDAYRLQNDQLAGTPDWAKNTRYDIEAKVDDEDRDALKKLTIDQRAAMVQRLLVDRFHLKTHTEMRELPVFYLVVAKGGMKIAPSPPLAEDAKPKMRGISSTHDTMTAADCPLDLFARVLSQLTEHLVVNKTGIEAHFDFTIKYSTDTTPADPDHAAPSIYTALQEQLGLRLDATKAPVSVLVVDQIDQPTPD